MHIFKVSLKTVIGPKPLSINTHSPALMARAGGADRTTLTLKRATLDRLNAFLRNPAMISKFQLVPQNHDDALNGLIDIAEREGR